MRLALEALTASRGAVPVLRGLTLGVAAGEVVAVMGRNGAGKSTCLEAIMGQVRLSAGAIRLDGARIDGLPTHRVPRLGIGYVPQGRRLFGDLSVAENLEVGLMARGGGRRAAVRAGVLERFPRLGARLGQAAGTLSGGEQQMVAIARALCLEPSVLLLDEPSEGLQPSMRALIERTVRDLRAAGTAILLVEHRVETALAVADRIAFVAAGACVETCASRDLTPEAPQFRAHLGV